MKVICHIFGLYLLLAVSSADQLLKWNDAYIASLHNYESICYGETGTTKEQVGTFYSTCPSNNQAERAKFLSCVFGKEGYAYKSGDNRIMYTDNMKKDVATDFGDAVRDAFVNGPCVSSISQSQPIDSIALNNCFRQVFTDK